MKRLQGDSVWVIVVAALVLATTLAPYLYGAFSADGRIFMWLGYNLDDSCVYLSWMRQARDGAWRGYNLFTTSPQHGMLLNPLFLALGLIARITHLPLLVVYHASRLLFGLLLLLLVWQLIRETLRDGSARRLAFLFVGISSGLGWLPFWWNDNPILTSVDKWQPEAITFLSLYLTPLFCFSMALQVAILLLLFRAEQSGSWKEALYAGFCGLILALVHTYDVISLALVWLTYLVLISLRDRSLSGRRWTGPWLRALLAGAITAPGVLYIAYQLRSEAVFQQRADVATLSPPPVYIFLGYGLTLLLALAAVYSLVKDDLQAMQQGRRETSVLWLNSDGALLIVCWAVANFAAAYLPTAFQRKMLQGEHFPIAILAGAGAAWLLSLPRLKIAPQFRLAAGTAVGLLLSITNIRFMLRDVSNFQSNLAQTHQQRPYMKAGEWEALRWIDAHVPKGVAVQPLPYLKLILTDDGHAKLAATDMTLACFMPGMTHHPVYCGHWGETPDYGGKLQELTRFALPNTTDAERTALLKKMKVRYLIYSQKESPNEDADRLAPMFREMVPPPPYLNKVYSNPDADIYEIDDKILQSVKSS